MWRVHRRTLHYRPSSLGKRQNYEFAVGNLFSLCCQEQTFGKAKRIPDSQSVGQSKCPEKSRKKKPLRIYPNASMRTLWLLAFFLKTTYGEEEPPAKGLIQMKKTNQHLFDFGSVSNASFRRMPIEDLTLLRFVLDFVEAYHWESVVFFLSNSSEWSKSLSPVILNYFNAQGKFLSVHCTSKPLLPGSILHQRHNVGVVYFYDVAEDDFLSKVSDLGLFDAYRSWLIIRKKVNKNKLEETLNGLNLGLDTNMIIATIETRTILPTVTSPTTTETTPVPLISYRKRHVQDQTCLRRFKRERSGDPNLLVSLTQVYKASKTENFTLTINLGVWDVPNGMLKARRIVPVELRWDLGGSKISVGIRNSSQETRVGNSALNKFSMENEADEESHFMELFDCLSVDVNASFDLVQFQKLGWRNEDGGWTHLLGGVVDRTIDFALETVDPNIDKSHDMSFTYAIVITMNNIYFRRPKSGGLRDIFLASFSTRLLLCVLTTSFLLAVAMISITIVNHQIAESKKPTSNFQILTRKRQERSVVITTTEARKWEISEAVLWSVSVLCMQGSQWSPKSFSGSLLLINSLIFALIIYNSFAAFITSVLSVKDVKIKDLKDLVASDFAFGYTLGNADELFLRTVNDTLLRELYFKGLRENDGVPDPIIGMHRAAKGKYAFFVSARTARRALSTVVAHDKRCEFQELYLLITKSYASIPVTGKSPLKKILNYKIMRLLETGILDRFQKRIFPSMPRCVEKTTFNSARLTDVYSAFFVLTVGWIASLLILASEIVWYKRRRMRTLVMHNEKFAYSKFKAGDQIFWLR